jgi:hypothetical protein
MSGTTYISRKSLNKYKEKLSWKGFGNESEPIIIDSINGLKRFIKIKNTSKYLHIKDIEIFEIQLIKCKNIIIENCKLINLILIACSNLTIKDNNIVDGNLSYCRENNFKNNLLDQKWAAHTLSEDGSKAGDNKMRYLQTIFIVPAIIVISLSILGFFFKDFLTGFIFFFTSLIPLGILINIRKKKMFTRNLGPNIFQNNKIESLKDFYSKYEDFKSKDFR